MSQITRIILGWILFGISQVFAANYQNFPQKVSEYFVNPTEAWEGGNPYDGNILISRISPNIYSLDFLFKNPINKESFPPILTLTNCLADHVAEMTQSKGWDVGHDGDLFDKNPIPSMHFLILTGVKDGESREHATGRKNMFWTYENILNNRDLRYSNSYPSVVGECKKLLKPEFSTYLAPNNWVYVNGKKVPTRLWALTSEEQKKQNSVDWDSMKNAAITYKAINPRLLKITFNFDEPLNNMYMLSMTTYAGCIGSYMAPKKEYEVFALGWPQSRPADSSGDDTHSSFVFYTLGLNVGDDIQKLSGSESINWLSSPGKDEISQMKITSMNMANVCPKLVNPVYLGESQ